MGIGAGILKYGADAKELTFLWQGKDPRTLNLRICSFGKRLFPSVLCTPPGRDATSQGEKLEISLSG